MLRRTPNIVLLGLAALFGAVLAGAFLGGRGAGASTDSPAATANPQQLSRSFQRAARRVRPSVLNITTERQSRTNRNGPLFRMLEEVFQQRQSPKLEQTYGTGFVVRADGIALTNHHVVANAKRVLVRLYDGREVSAVVVGIDPLTDVAVIRLGPHPDAIPYVPVEYGDDAALEVGDWVLAVGNPFGLDQTVTAGIVSAKGRSRLGVAAYEDFIQTDAAINPGNSGGPLLDLEGRVVGMTTAIASRSGQYAGIGFAIPIDMARGVMDVLLENGRVSRGWLGVSVQDLSPETLTRLGYGEIPAAPLVSRVVPGPASEAGLRPGDLILAIDGARIRDGQDLGHRVAQVPVGQKFKMSVRRGSETITLEAIAVERPDTPDRPTTHGPATNAPGTTPSEVGISARVMTPELARFFGFTFNEKEPSVVVARVERSSLAFQQGVRPGMIIQQVERTLVTNLDDLQAALNAARLEGKGVVLRVWDGRSSRVVVCR
ncbi:MAG: trypsin-like peptidase domain-containing protein [Planctomycetes bacterium]|nr:trypsin-like peptidase domain-containing protein [Planctomycetota bacterium]